jgi:monoamine oxidase
MGTGTRKRRVDQGDRRLVDTEIAIVGAGAAGLSAARRLAERGHRTVVLEARDRIGGRMFTRPDPGTALPIELGAEFIHGNSPLTRELLRIGGATTIDIGDDFWRLVDGRLVHDDEGNEASSKIIALARDLGTDTSVEAILQRALAKPALREAVTRTRMMVEGFDAADTAIASARAIAAEWFSDAGMGGTEGRPLGGYAPLVQTLQRSLDPALVEVMPGAVVQRIAWQRGSVTIEGLLDGAPCTIRARAAIVTVPIGVLRADGGAEGAIAFDPPLPSATSTALAAIEMGPVVKVLLRFARAFWEEADDGRYADGAFFLAPDAPFPTCWTQVPLRGPLLTAWAGGTRAAALHGFGEDALIARAIASAQQLFPQCHVAELLDAAHVHDWQRDPYARGAYSYLRVGGEHAREALAAPLDATVFIAGEATATGGHGGTVAGALHEGYRAAEAAAAVL